MICRQCGKPYPDDSSGFCHSTCKHRFGQIQDIDAEIDWFACKLRQFIIRQSWPDRELQQRCRPEWKRVEAEVPEFSESDLEAAI